MAHASVISFVLWLGISVGLLALFMRRFFSEGKTVSWGKFVGYFILYIIILSTFFIGSLAFVSAFMNFSGSLVLWLLLYCILGLIIGKIDRKNKIPFYYFSLIPLVSATILALYRSSNK